tara:strand:+ start:214 stop:744 length:531 start_codon:yes stop_codon:yes gene_type:complete
MIEIITDYVIPTGGIYAFGLFSIHIADSVRFIATRLGILNSSQSQVNEPEASDQSSESEQDSRSGEEEFDSEMLDTMEGGFATISQILADMGERHERSDTRMRNLHKHNQSMFSRITSRMDSNERLFEEIVGPLEEIIEGIHDSPTTSNQVSQLETTHSAYEGIQVDTEMEVNQYD